MLILALDTTTPAGSSALTSDEVVLCEDASNGRPPAERLPRELMGLLDRAGRSLADVDVFAVATGPGSFTGLRIGIATMQGLAFAAGKPLVGVSGFQALAHLAEAEAGGIRIATWVDAWRGEVYAARYGRDEAEAPIVAAPDALLSALEGTPTLFIGDGARTYAGAIRAKLGAGARIAANPVPLLAGTVARLAAEMALSGVRPHPHAIRPLYVRRTDAELARERTRQ
jgi:tRNA threonylcarbamoyladenosine biosynthesis protein TsaB